MRNFNDITVNELFDQLPTIEEAFNYNYQWYKEREKDYGDFYKNTSEIEKVADWQLNNFIQLYKDKENLSFIEDAEEDLKSNMSGVFNSFQHASTIHALAKNKEKEWNKMIEEMDEIIANF